MINEEQVQVVEIIEETEEVIRLRISGGCGKAVLYKSLHPEVHVGEWVVVNKTATELNLGTGGWDIVRSVIDRHSITIGKKKQLGHIMKARYLGDQHSVLSLESPESGEHSLFKQRFRLERRPIYLAELHSMLPIVWFLLEMKGDIRLTTIISDEASLPMAISENLAYLNKQANFHSITAGQAFGGKSEAINVTTALQYANEKFQDGIILVTLGPGVVGTNTYYGFSGLVQADWANRIGSLGGVPVWIPRLSAADLRTRHQGISHHTMTPLTELTHAKSIVPFPKGPYSDQWLKEDIDYLSSFPHIELKPVREEFLLPYLKGIQELSPFPLTTMGRTIDKDPLFFLGVAAACFLYFEELEHQSANVSYE